MSLRFRQVFAALIIGAPLSVAYANDVQLVYYDIVGNSANSLRHELDINGPLDKDGKRFDGLTKWHVTWTYRYAPTEAGCKFTEINTSVEGTTTLPRWVDGDSATNSLIRKWQNYIAALRLHEDGHYAHGVGAAKEIEDLGQSFHVSDNCSTIAKKFNDQASSILEKYMAMDAIYDHDTNHGQTQGARFP